MLGARAEEVNTVHNGGLLRGERWRESAVLGRPGEEIEGQEGRRPECGQCGQCWLQATKRLEVGEGSLAGGGGWGGGEGGKGSSKKKTVGSF